MGGIMVDDNFGVYDMGDDPEGTMEFYRYVQKNSVRKKCKGCGRMVKIMPQYAYCDPCTRKREMGMDF
jgi:hypothetical protein